MEELTRPDHWKQDERNRLQAIREKLEQDRKQYAAER